MSIRLSRRAALISSAVAVSGAALPATGWAQTSADTRSDDEIAAAAEAAGLTFVHIPIRGGAMTPDDVARFKAALADLPQPILGYCRSGTRTTYLWALSQAGERPVEEIVALAAAAGYDVSPLGPRLEG